MTTLLVNLETVFILIFLINLCVNVITFTKNNKIKDIFVMLEEPNM